MPRLNRFHFPSSSVFDLIWFNYVFSFKLEGLKALFEAGARWFSFVLRGNDGIFSADFIQKLLFSIGEFLLPALRKLILAIIAFLIFAGFPLSVALANSDQLHTVGNKILTLSGGCTLRLKGVNVDGMEFDPSGNQGPPGQGITATVAEAVTAWNCNIVRIPMNQDYWFGCGGGGPNYQILIDEIVSYCQANNAYALLDLHWSGKQTGNTSPCGTGWGNDANTKQQYMPDDNSVTFWSSVAARYANNSAVLFDLYNEPYDYSGGGWNIWRNGGTEATYGFHTPGMQLLLTVIRSAGANNVVVAGGLDYAYDLTGVSGYALTDVPSGNGIIYSSHVYPWKGTSNPSFPGYWGPNDGNSKITPIASTYPVLIGEFGENYYFNPPTNSVSDPNGNWDQLLLNWMDANNFSGTGWDMHTSSSPILVSDWNFTPTSWHGVPVKSWLAIPQTPCATSTPTETFTPTDTNTPCMIFGNTCTPTFTPTATFTVTSTPTPSNLYVVYPNPWPDSSNPGDTLSFYYQNDQAADLVKLKIYTLAYRKIYEDDSLPTGQGSPGPQTLNVTNLNLANGLYYFVLVRKTGSHETQKVMKVLIRR